MDIKDSYLHGTVGVVKSISVSADKLTYKLADINNTAKTITLPLATTTANGLMSKDDKLAINSLGNYVTLNTDQDITGTKTFTKQLKFTVALGTAPFLVTSDTLVTNLNVNYLDGYGINSVVRVISSDTLDANAVQYPGIIRLGQNNPNIPSNCNYGNLLNVKRYSSDTAFQLLGSYSNDLLYFRRGTWYADGTGSINTNKWKQIAFTDSNITGNAATATKLQTKRKLWGLDFDGTADVSGNLTGVKYLFADPSSTLELITPSESNLYIYFRYNNNDLTSVALTGTGFVPTAASSNKITLGATSNKWKAVYATDFIGNLDGTYVNKLTGYKIADVRGAIATSDSLNIALGKLEYKAYLGETAYDLVKGAYDGDGTIENLAEILKVLEGIKDTETIKAIIGKYLPLAGGTLTGNLTLEGNGSYRQIIVGLASGYHVILANSMYAAVSPDTNREASMSLYNGTTLKGAIGVKTYPFFVDSDSKVHTILHSGNTYINSGTITINGTSITPLTLHLDLTRYFKESRGNINQNDLDTFASRHSGTYNVYVHDSNGNLSYSYPLICFYNPGSSGSALELISNYSNTELKVRTAIDNKKFTAWKTIAFTDSNITGNAASADKLKTARKLWGQSFDGTADVKGDMTGVGSIRMDNDSCLFVKNTEGSIINLLTLNLQNLFALGWSTCPNGYLTSIYGNVITFGTGSNRNEIMRLNSNGKVGIGATNPDSILHVNGVSNNGTPVLKVTSTSTTSDYNYVASFLSPNLGEKGNVIMSLGVAHDTKKCAILQYITDSDVSKNRLAIGHYGGIQMLTVGASNVGIGTTNPSTTYKLDVVSSTINVIRVKSSGNESSIAYDSASSSWTAGVGTGSSGNAFGFWSNTAGKNVLTVKSDDTVHASTFVGNVLLGKIHNIKSAVYNATYTSGTWYRIMVSDSDKVADATGELVMYMHSSGYPVTLKLSFGVSYHTYPFLLCNWHTGWAYELSKARIVYKTSYGSQKAYLEVYACANVTHETTFSFVGTGWSFMTPTATTEEYTENLNTKCEIELNPERPVIYSSTIKSKGFIKTDSNNSYVLLGGGGHKAVSDFITDPTALFTSATSTRDANLSLTIGGTTKTIKDLYATSLRVRNNGYDTNPKGEWSKIKTSTTPMVVNVYDVYNDGGPTEYGNVLEIVGITKHWQPQLWFGGWAKSSLYHRNKDYDTNTWGDWYTILDSNNYKSYLGYIGTTAVQSTSAVLNLTGIGHITSGANKTYSLGNLDNRWLWVYSISLSVGQITVSPLNGKVYGIALGWTDCGNDDNGTPRPWYGLTWGSAPDYNQMLLSNYFGMTFRTGSADYNFVFKEGNLRPSANVALTLGTTSYRWSTVYGDKGNFSGILTVADAVKITSTSGVKYLLMGNQDSGGVNNPVVMYAANGRFTISNGDSWENLGGTTTPIILFEKGGVFTYANLLPNTTNTLNLGSGSLKWKNLYILGIINSSLNTGSHLYGNQGGAIINATASRNAYVMLASMPSTNGVFCLGVYTNSYMLYYTKLETIDKGSNAFTAALTLLDESGNSYFPGNVSAVRLIKSGSDDNYVLLGGGGHKALSSITASALNSTTVISAKVLSLSNASWTDTGYTFESLASGTYAVQITCGNLVASGIMSIYKNIDDTAGDEIPLHVYHDSTQPWRPYLRTSGKKLLISSNDASATSRKVTIKIALIL